MAENVLTGQSERLKECTICSAGWPCKDYSDMLSMAQKIKYKDSIRTEVGQSGIAFGQVKRTLVANRCPIYIYIYIGENVGI